MKVCYKCKQEKEVSKFSLTPSGNPRGVCKSCRVKSSTAYLYKNTYGITLEEAQELKKVQDYKCAICGIAEKEHSRGVLFVDHCHGSGKVRGMLCSHCNKMTSGKYLD